MDIALDTIFLGIMVLVATSAFGISFFSYLRVRSSRLLWLSLAFLVFLIKGIFLTLSVLTGYLDFFADSNYPLIFDTVVIIFIILVGIWE